MRVRSDADRRDRARPRAGRRHRARRRRAHRLVGARRDRARRDHERRRARRCGGGGRASGSSGSPTGARPARLPGRDGTAAGRRDRREVPGGRERRAASAAVGGAAHARPAPAARAGAPAGAGLRSRRVRGCGGRPARPWRRPRVGRSRARGPRRAAGRSRRGDPPDGRRRSRTSSGRSPTSTFGRSSAPAPANTATTTAGTVSRSATWRSGLRSKLRRRRTNAERLHLPGRLRRGGSERRPYDHGRQYVGHRVHRLLRPRPDEHGRPRHQHGGLQPPLRRSARQQRGELRDQPVLPQRRPIAWVIRVAVGRPGHRAVPLRRRGLPGRRRAGGRGRSAPGCGRRTTYRSAVDHQVRTRRRPACSTSPSASSTRASGASWRPRSTATSAWTRRTAATSRRSWPPTRR